MSETALIECDFCSDMVQEAWYVEHGGFQFLVMDGAQVVDHVNIHEGQMAACPTCWPLIQAKNLSGLIDHFFARHPTEGRQREVVKHYIEAYHGGVLKRLTGKVEHVAWSDPKPQAVPFFDYTCPNCGCVLHFDSSEYDRSIERKCPNCGTEIVMVSKPGLAETPNLIMNRVYIVQCLCPSRHCIMACPMVLPAEATEMELEKAKEPLRALLSDAIKGRLLNPWCELCKAPAENWNYEIGRTKWETIEEAMPHLRENERRQWESQQAIKALQREALNN